LATTSLQQNCGLLGSAAAPLGKQHVPFWHVDGPLQSPFVAHDPQAYWFSPPLKVQCPPMSDDEQLVHVPTRLLLTMTPPHTASLVPAAHVPLLQQPPLQGCICVSQDVVQACFVESHASSAAQSVRPKQPHW
jgi:hypothetical protein